jgi:UDP-glucose 4-epimerase
MRDGASAAFNLGNGNGFSVLEVIHAAEKVTGRKVEIEDGPRRRGDAARLVADSGLIRRQLGWSPAYSGLETIVKHAWAWENKAHAR